MGESELSGAVSTVLATQALEAVISAAPLPIISVDLDGRVTTWNPAATQMFGWRQEEVLGKPLPVIPPEQREVAQLIRMQTEQGGTLRDVEVLRQRRDGNMIPLSLSTAPLLDERGEIAGTMLIYADLTVRKAAEAIQRQQAAVLRERAALLDLTQEAIFVRELDTAVIRYWNRGAEALYGFTPQEAIGEVSHSLLKTVFPEPQERVIATLLEAGRWSADLRHTAKDGRQLIVASRWALHHDELGRQAGALEVNTDVTEARRLEEEVRRHQERQQAIIATQREIAAAEMNLDAIMQQVIERMRDLTGAELAGVEMVEGDELVYRAFSDPSGLGIRVRLDASLSGLAVRTGQLQVSNNVEEDPRVDAAAVARLGVKSAVAFPLHHGGMTIGAVLVLSTRLNAFGPREVESLELVAGQLSAAMSHAAQWEAEQALARERALALERMQQSEEQLRRLIEQAPVGICLVDADGIFEQVNEAYAAILGYRAGELLGQHVKMIVPAERLDEALETHRRLLEQGAASLTEAEAIRKDGKTATLLTNTIPLTGPRGEQRRVTFALDITERKETERALEHQARHDALTGLVNRIALYDRLELALRRARRESEKVAVLFVDLDGFKAINDRFGHDEGDALLVRVAQHLLQAVRASDTVARLAGDEFVLLLPNIGSPENAVMVAEKVLASLQGLTTEQASGVISASIGIGVFPSDAQHAAQLLECADTAMYRAKRRGKNIYALYGEEERAPGT